ncbi:MAG: ABC transporter substrate-binding protein, partial [Myxococcota bacterium]|nr:ABC transporter substrate-binding protein [Myxococcota bacterium]
QAAKNADVLMVSPASTTSAITQLEDKGLLWRTVPSDEEQGKALAGAIAEQGFERVAVVSRDDAYGNGLRERIQAELCGVLGFDCTTSYKGYVYAPPEGEVFDLDFAPEVQAFAPNLVVMVSYLDDGVAAIQALSAEGLVRFWATDGMKSEELGPLIANDDVVCKLLGTSPAQPTTFYSGFTTNFETKFGQTPGTFVSNAYDALYLVAYAAAAAQGLGGPLDGPSIAAGLKRLSGAGAPQFEVGRLDWNTGITALTSDAEAEIDLTGASGTLTFDPDTGQPSGPVEVWRFGVVSGEIESLGVIYTPADGYTSLPTAGLSRDGICEL